MKRHDLIGAHVSIAGGFAEAPPRALTIGATAIQIFTKTPNQWRERAVTSAEAAEFKAAVAKAGIGRVVAHDSYLINLASPDPVLRARSVAAFNAELARAELLAVEGVVSHPGNYMDDRAAGLVRNAAGYTECLRAVPGAVMVYIEATAGTGTVLGSTFEELKVLRDQIGEDVRHRVAFCADTCHLYSAGYDLVGDFAGVWKQWDRVLGFDLLRCLHLNDSATPFGSRKDRHALIGKGSLGVAPFRAIMTDRRFRSIPKILETPKGDDEVTNDRNAIRRLRRLAAVKPAR